MSGVVSEAGAMHHAHPGQGPRSNFPSAESADQARPFASMLDGTSNTSLPPSSPKTAPGTQKSPSDSPAPEGQTGGVASSPLQRPQADDIADTVLALGASAKNTAKDTKSATDAGVDATVTSSVTDAAAGNNAVDATGGSSTAAAITDGHGDKTARSDSGTSDGAQPAIPPADPSANQPVPVAPQPVAVPVSAPVPAAPATIGSGNGSGTGQDAAQIAALGDAVKAGAPRGKADRAGGAEAATSGGAAAGTQPDGGTKPGAKTADAVVSTAPPAPQPTRRDLISPTGPGQPNAPEGTQSRNADAVPATEAAHAARQRAVGSRPNDGSAGPQGDSSIDPNVDPNVDPKRDSAGSTNRIEDITRQALDTTVRHVEAPASETAGGGASRPDNVQAGSAPQSPDGSVAPAILTTSAAPAAAPTTTATPAAIPIAGLAVEIAAHARGGKNRFEIRLDPPELGRIDVRLDVDREGKVTSRLVVDRPETLDILRRDAPELERSLQQAGLKTADDALQFSLRDHGGFGSQNPYSNNGSPAGATRVIIPDRELPPVDAATAGYGRVIRTSTGVDIRV